MDPDQAAATEKIAAAQRGKAARKELAEKKDASAKIAAAQRGKAARKERVEADKASTTIQARYRGKRSRSRTVAEGTQRYYTPAEVGSHNLADDLWVSFFQKVYNLTPLVVSHAGHLVQPIIDAAGTDISHWFDPITKNVRTYIDSKTELEVPFTPMGHFLHCPPAEPVADWSSNVGTPWWRDRSLCIGRLTVRTRKIKLLNMLTKQESTLVVCCEETLEEVQRRYMAHNAHSGSYVWKRTDTNMVARKLDMKLTLEENGIKDECDDFDTLDIDPDYYIPTIHLYFADDLTIA